METDARELLALTEVWLNEQEEKDAGYSQPEGITLVSVAFCIQQAAKAHGAPERVVDDALYRVRRVTEAHQLDTHDVLDVKAAKALLFFARTLF